MTANRSRDPSAPAPERVKKAKKATMVAVFGTFIEYYDFSVYGYVAATLAVVFFPSDDPAMGLLNTLLVFGAAFVVRPIGAIFFGRLGDKKGRRTSLIASVTLMGAAGFITGLLPGYAQIGVWAPILLVLMRILQGFSTGGEIGGAASYIREWAPPKRRPLYISFIPSIAQLGKGIAAGIAALIALACPDRPWSPGAGGSRSCSPSRWVRCAVHAAAGRGQPRVRRRQGQGQHRRQAGQGPVQELPGTGAEGHPDRHRADHRHLRRHRLHLRVLLQRPGLLQGRRLHRRAARRPARRGAHPDLRVAGQPVRRQTHPGHLLPRLRPAHPAGVPADEPGQHRRRRCSVSRSA